MGYYWFWSFWWLIFPLMGFCFAIFGMWMGYRAHWDRMELFKTYAAQGKDPAELAKAMGQADGTAPWAGHYGPGPWGPGPCGYGRWGYGRWGYWGPFREWRRAIVFTCLALGFGLASQYAEIPGAEHGFRLVAIIMGVLAAGSFLLAIVASFMSGSMNQDPTKGNGG